MVNANMLRGMRRTTVEKGIDARDHTLLAFGGAGPIHAAELAAELGIGEVLAPGEQGVHRVDEERFAILRQGGDAGLDALVEPGCVEQYSPRPPSSMADSSFSLSVDTSYLS